jgi:hypothetical protein
VIAEHRLTRNGQEVADMGKMNFERFAWLSGRGVAKALDTLAEKGIDVRKALDTPIKRVPRRDPPPSPSRSRKLYRRP